MPPINPCRQGQLGLQAGTLAWGFLETALPSRGPAQLLLPGERSSSSSQQQLCPSMLTDDIPYSQQHLLGVGTKPLLASLPQLLCATHPL